MTRARAALPVAALALALGAHAACGQPAEERPTSEPGADGASTGVATAEDPVEPVPVPVGLDPRKVELGRRLFADPILHERGAFACTHCHVRAHGGADGRRMSDVDGQPAALVNTPTIYNVGLSYRFNWNGRFVDLEEQLDGPILNPRVMATTFEAIVRRLRGHPEYPAAFAAAYGAGITEAAVRDAIASYERSLVTPDAPFDRYLRGDRGALGPEEVEGYTLFKTHGCISCHQGVNVGGNMIQRFGVFGDYFRARGGDITDADLGLYAVTRREEDRHVFRVPSLRNVAKTAPYFHDGSAKTLEEAIQTMSEIQLGRPLAPPQVRSIAAFLRTLSGRAPESLP